MQTTWLERGIVSSRVALLLRSAEIQPLFEDLSIRGPPPLFGTVEGPLGVQLHLVAKFAYWLLPIEILNCPLWPFRR